MGRIPHWPDQGHQGDEDAAPSDLALREAVAALIATEDLVNKAWIARMRLVWGSVSCVWVFVFAFLRNPAEAPLMTTLLASVITGFIGGRVAALLARDQLVARSRQEVRRQGDAWWTS